jgi:hypothetical protein
MGRKMAARILTVSLALIFLGMVFPSQSDSSVGTTNEVDLGQVLINSSKVSTTFIIQNENEQSWVTLYFNYLGDCGFEYDTTLQGRVLGIKGAPDDSATMTIEWETSELGVCSDDFTVYYYADDFVIHEVTVVLKGEGVDKLGPSTVIIDGQDTGVENRLHEEQTISERLEKCSESARNHGQYVRCVALMLRKMHKANVLSRGDMKVIMKAAAQANIPPRESGLEDLVYNGEPVTDLIEACKDNAKNNRQYRRCVFDLMKDLKKEGVIEGRKQKHQIRKYAARLKFHGAHKKK